MDGGRESRRGGRWGWYFHRIDRLLSTLARRRTKNTEEKNVFMGDVGLSFAYSGENMKTVLFASDAGNLEGFGSGVWWEKWKVSGKRGTANWKRAPFRENFVGGSGLSLDGKSLGMNGADVGLKGSVTYGSTYTFCLDFFFFSLNIFQLWLRLWQFCIQ